MSDLEALRKQLEFLLNGNHDVYTSTGQEEKSVFYEEGEGALAFIQRNFPKHFEYSWKVKCQRNDSGKVEIQTWKSIRCIPVWNLHKTQCFHIPTTLNENGEVCLRLTDIQRLTGDNGVAGILEIPFKDLDTKLQEYSKFPENQLIDEVPKTPAIHTNMEGQVTVKDLEYFIRPKLGWKVDAIYKVHHRLKAVCGLAFSGGGYRAMLIHLGACSRLVEFGDLLTRDTITSVSGGSILSGFLATVWDVLKNAPKEELPTLFEILVAEPVRRFAQQNIAIPSLLEPASMLKNHFEKAEKKVKEEVINKYKEKFPKIVEWLRPRFHEPVASVLPKLVHNSNNTLPTFFVICSTDSNNGTPFYFTQQYVGPNLPSFKDTLLRHGPYGIDEEKGKQLAQVFTLSQAIAASAAFPAFSPFPFDHPSGNKIFLMDGGVYDNLGLEPLNAPNIYLPPEHADKPHQIIYASDGGLPLLVSPKLDFPIPVISVLLRTTSIMMEQVSQHRIKALKEEFQKDLLFGAIWRMEDLWDYYSYIRRYNELDNPKYPVKYRQFAELLTKTLPNEGFPDLERLFGFTLGKAPGSNTQVPTMIKMIQSVRTDMDKFYEDEIEIMETLGYTLAAYKIRLYCRYKKPLPFNSAKREVFTKWFTPSEPEGKKLDEKVIEALKYSDSILDIHENRMNEEIFKDAIKQVKSLVTPQIEETSGRIAVKLREWQAILEAKKSIKKKFTIPPYQIPYLGGTVTLTEVEIDMKQLLKYLKISLSSTNIISLIATGKSKSDTTIDVSLYNFNAKITGVKFDIQSYFSENGTLEADITGNNLVSVTLYADGEEKQDWKIGIKDLKVKIDKIDITVKPTKHTILTPIAKNALLMMLGKGVLEKKLEEKIREYAKEWSITINP